METYRAAQHAHGRTCHLTKLYSDTKKSALFNANSTATEQFPALNRKFRIQKDRLITWGLAWSDDGKGEDGNIDDAVARADLTETVDSVLNNIKEVSEEAARIQQAASPLGVGIGGEKKLGETTKAGTFDQARYEDLLQDLTTSIDILYDLSRSRKALARGEHPSFSSPSEKLGGNEKQASMTLRTSALGASSIAPSFVSTATTLINQPSFQRPGLSPYAGLPPRIDISALKLAEEGPPPYEALGVPSTTRLVAKLVRSKVSEIVQSAIGSSASEVPVLIEYANFDPIYRDTHVPPPLQRLEALTPYLQPMRPESQNNLSLLGYFEDANQPRIGLVYDVPYSIQNKLQGTVEAEAQVLEPVSLLKLEQKANKTQSSSNEVVVPPLEHRFRLALRLVEQLHDLHARELPHGNINSSSVIFATTAGESALHPGHMRSPLWAAFDLFSKCSVEGQQRDFNLNIYRHPDDIPKDHRELSWDIRFDLYSLALVLLEVGLWTPIGALYKAKYTLHDFKLRIEKLWMPKLASKCGSAYMKVVQACFRMADDSDISQLTTEGLYTYLFEKLRLCCLLDEDEYVTEPASVNLSFDSVAASHSQGLSEPAHLTRHQKQPADMMRLSSASTPSLEPSTRLASTPNLYDAGPSVVIDQLARQPIALAQAPSISHLRDQVSNTLNDATLSFKDYKQKVTLIQQRWRECRSQIKDARADIRAIALSSPTRHATNRSNARPLPANAEPPEPESKSKRQEFQHLPLPEQCEQDWNCKYAYQLAKVVERALKGSKESSDIRFVMYGESEETAKPTFLLSCEKSTAKVKHLLKRHFKYDASIYDLRVKRCAPIKRCRRSKKHGDSAAYRSMAPFGAVEKAVNPDYQERPLCGASIGAFRDEEHLPPVSFGGIVLVDGTAYGMSVHHMLEPDSEDDFEEEDAEAGPDDGDSDTSSIRSSDSISIYGHSDDESTVRPPSTALLDTDDTEEGHDGDLPGVLPGDYDEIPITQPALDDAIDLDLHVDVDEDDDEEDSGIDEDHLLSYKLGQVHASSGLKRSPGSAGQDGFKSISQSLPQEIDWALFELVPPRTYPYNVVRGGSRFCAVANKKNGHVYPTAIRSSTELACDKVHCLGRTSGLASGVMSSSMELVKIHGRSTFSASWTVSGDFGVGGDSGAWVISNEDGRVCGHVLASTKGRTYICPMELLLNDIKETLGAKEVSLPIASRRKAVVRATTKEVGEMVNDAMAGLRVVDDVEASGGVAVPADPVQRSKGKPRHCKLARKRVGVAG
ncbi:hypothetical protein Tdes44962_MAKER06621 [Teratosphaeria destructans]|uniref:Protein kinase domain-containing protein n=1 Tax=Teratosphaeria destructans TaxID=418781 RepID=A0A9W7T0U9_9PEZI|nr:hypothetical protein Tdes44962_MAKER06621 [Teratosphaeria destructans]